MRGQTKLFKSVGVPTTCPVVTSDHSEKRGSFLNQKANWISSTYDNSYKPKIQFEFNDSNLNLSCQDIHWRALGRTDRGREIQREILEENDVYFVIGLSRLFRDDYWPLIVGIYPLPNIEIDYGNI